MNNFYFLNLNIPLLKEDISLDSIPKNKISILDRDIINNDMINFLNHLNLEIVLIESFFKSPNGFLGGIHVDSVGGDFSKLIWVFGGGNSEMVWYKPLFEKTKKISQTEESTPFIAYSKSEVIEIERTSIKNPTLVQVGVPHGIENITEDRLCIGIIFQDKNSKKRLTMKDSVLLFQNYIT